MIVVIIIGVLLGGLITYWILHEVVQSAIDNSTMARNIQEIRDHLVGNKAAEPHTGDENHENCPGCNHPIHKADRVCSSCGLALRDWD